MKRLIKICKYTGQKAFSFLKWLLPGYDLKSLIFSSLHAIWMIIFSLLWLIHINMFDGFDFMNDVMDYKDLITKNILKVNPKTTLKDKYLLINTSKNSQLLPGDNDNQINIVITDREKLTKVLTILDNNSDKIKYIICDIFFGESDTLNDKQLEKILMRLDEKEKIIIPFFITEEDKYCNSPIFNINAGLAQYKTSFLNTQYLKFSYIAFDTVKQMPLVAYEDITGIKMKKGRFIGMNYYMMNKKWCLNTVIPEFRYTSNDIIPDVTIHDLGFFTENMIGKDQIVIIGDFEGIRDKHHSMVDEVAGPLILINAIESLFRGDNLIEFCYLLLLFFLFFVITYHTFYKSRNRHYSTERKTHNIFSDFLYSNMNYLLVLVMTLISMLFFHHYFHLLILLSYFGFIEIVIKAVNAFKKKNFVANGNT